MGLELLWIVLAVEAALGVYTVRMGRRRVNAWIRAWKEALPKDFVVSSKRDERRRVHLKAAGNRELWVDFLCKDAPYAALSGPKRNGLRHTTRDSMAEVLDPEDAAALDVAGLLAIDPLQYRRLEVEIFDHGVRLIVRRGALGIDIADRCDRMRRIVDAMDANDKTPAETLRQIYRSKLSVPRRLSALLALRAIDEQEALETARADIDTLPEEDRVWVARHILQDVELLERWVNDETLEPATRSLSMRGIAAHKPTRALELARHFLNTGNATLICDAVVLNLTSGIPVSETDLVRALQDVDAVSLVELLQVIERHKLAVPEELVWHGLENERERVRRATIRILSRVGTPNAVERLKNLIGDRVENAEERAASRAIGEIRVRYPAMDFGGLALVEDQAAHGLSPVDTTGGASLVEGRSAADRVGDAVVVEDVVEA